MAESSIAQAAAHKQCTRCGETKPADRRHFSPVKRGIYGLNAWCKPCMAEWRRDDRKRNPERYKASERKRDGEKRREQNRQSWKVNGARYRAAAAARVKARAAVYNANRRSKLASLSAPDLEARHAKQREWYASNRDDQITRRREAWRGATAQRRLRTWIGSAISHALRGTGKGGRGWQDLVGYDLKTLTAHLERQFLKGMTWENYGPAWHLDHIVPVAAFSFSSPDDPDFKACWALTNLRPLWANINISKRAKRTHLL